MMRWKLTFYVTLQGDSLAMQIRKYFSVLHFLHHASNGLTNYENLNWDLFLEHSEHSHPTWELSVADVHDRTELLYQVRGRPNRGSVYFFRSTFPCTNSGAHWAMQSPTNDKQRDSCTRLWSLKKKKKKLAEICLNVVSDVWYFLLKADSSESTEKKSLIRWTAHHS